MIIEYELKGFEENVYKGFFDTTGFSVKYGFWGRYDMETNSMFIYGHKLISNCEFEFSHTDKKIFDEVYSSLLAVLAGEMRREINDIGYVRRIYMDIYEPMTIISNSEYHHLLKFKETHPSNFIIRDNNTEQLRDIP